jgi:hypothetical protein
MAAESKNVTSRRSRVTRAAPSVATCIIVPAFDMSTSPEMITVRWLPSFSLAAEKPGVDPPVVAPCRSSASP